MEGLFRKEVLDKRKHGLNGDVILLPKISHSVLLAGLIIWLMLVAVWLFTSHYARKETVLGWLEPPEGVVRIYADREGVVQKVMVSEGELVKEDQPLLILNQEHILASGENLDANILQEYSFQKKLLEEQLARSESTLSIQENDIAKRITSAQQNLIIIEDQLRATEERYNLIASQVARYTALKQQGHVSNAEYDAILSQELSLKTDRQTLLRSQMSQRDTLSQLRAQQKILPEQNANSVAEFHSRLSDLNQKITELEGHSYVIKATRSGVINNLQVIEGQHAVGTNNIPLLTILPENALLAVHLLIPVRSVGFIDAGQSLALRYDAFPYQKFGIYHATVAQVSKTLLLPTELLNVPVAIKEPVYRVTARLPSSVITAYGKQFSLRPGMTLSADIGLGDRTLVEWILEPIYSLKGRL